MQELQRNTVCGLWQRNLYAHGKELGWQNILARNSDTTLPSVLRKTSDSAA